ncbi:MAG: hypothetical protein KY476_26270 [Planctomycetes bacterium]|nr:hypothetical protein [Planctomycetota bacterium]
MTPAPRLRTSLAVLGFAVAILGGCGGDDDAAPDGNGGRAAGNGANGEAPIEPVQVNPANLKVLDWDGVQELVAAHQGKVVVVYLWASFNPASKNLFPQLVRLCRHHPQELSCIAVNLDYSGESPAESLREDVAAFVGEQGADFQHVVSSVPAETLYFEILDPELESGVPAVFVYGKDGQLAKRFDNDLAADAADGEKPREFTITGDVAPFVEKLLASP